MDPKKMAQRSEFRRYEGTVTRQFKHSGVGRGNSACPPANVEPDPSEGRKHVHTFAVIIRKPRFGLPSFVR